MYIRKAVVREMQKELKFHANHVLTDFSRDCTTEDADSQSELFLDDTPIEDVLNDADQWQEQNEARMELEGIRKSLDAREKVHLALIQEGSTQQEIATRLGVSQSRVSRLTTKLFAKCREISEA
jgi:RNA polymerase sigma factor (sigma-70 family)